MEPKVTLFENRRGFILVTVLVITAIGLLFGAGSLLLFRFQCQQRIDRQHELEKVYAVRSALNYIRMNSGSICEVGKSAEEGRSFRYFTSSSRDLGVTVKPVEVIFPCVTNEAHMIMEKEMAGRNFKVLGKGNQCSSLPDYEYGEISNGVVVAASGISGEMLDGALFGLQFKDLSVSNNVRWWVNIGMRDTGGWLQEEYGRRYFFHPYAYVHGNSTQDVMRLCLIRNVTNSLNAVGCKRGWPLSNDERALVFQISPHGGDDKSNNAVMTLSEWGPTGSQTLIRLDNTPSMCYMGLQIAENIVSIFYINNAGVGDTKSHGYSFSESAVMSDETFQYFKEGIYTNGLTGKVMAPELRAVIEVESSSDMRGKESAIDDKQLDFVSHFQVTPAYQYDVYLEHPSSVTNRATVAQLIGVYDEINRNVSDYTVLTYDTHGTEHKGFRRDEREAERKNGR